MSSTVFSPYLTSCCFDMRKLSNLAALVLLLERIGSYKELGELFCRHVEYLQKQNVIYHRNAKSVKHWWRTLSAWAAVPPVTGCLNKAFKKKCLNWHLQQFVPGRALK